MNLTEVKKSYLKAFREHGFKKFNLEHRSLVAKCDAEDRKGLLPEQQKYSRPVGKIPRGRVDMLEGSVQDSIFVLDWDDTILPTSYIKAKSFDVAGEEMLPQKVQQELKEIDELSLVLLKTIVFNVQSVLIITNGIENWVETSSKQYLPQVHSYLFLEKEGKENIKVVSARVHEFEHPTRPDKWKKKEFQTQLSQVVPEQYMMELTSDSVTLSPKSKAVDFSFSDEIVPIGASVAEDQPALDIAEVTEPLEIEQDNLCSLSEFGLDGFETVEEEQIDGGDTWDDSLSELLGSSHKTCYSEGGSSSNKRKRTRSFEDETYESVKMRRLDSEDKKKELPLLSIISMGDSLHDLTALTKFKCSETRCVRKAIKVKYLPRPEDLVILHKGLMVILSRLVAFNGSVALEFK